MFRVVQFLILAVLMMVQVNCAEQVQPEDSCGFVQNSDGQRVSWKSKKTVQFFVSNGVPQSVYPAIQAAAQVWNQTLGYSAINIVGTSASQDPAYDGRNVLYWLTTWTESNGSEQGNTTIYWQGNELVEADVKINAQGYQYAISSVPQSNEVDLKSLLIHEFGHALGLKHEDASPSVMNHVLARGTERVTPFEVDRVHIKCEYK